MELIILLIACVLFCIALVAGYFKGVYLGVRDYKIDAYPIFNVKIAKVGDNYLFYEHSQMMFLLQAKSIDDGLSKIRDTTEKKIVVSFDKSVEV